MLSRSEKKRRIWAAEQSPELITTEQALEMFGHRSFTGFKRYLLTNGIDVRSSARWPNCSFYEKTLVQALAAEYFLENPKRKAGAEKLQNAAEESLNPKKALHTFNKYIPDFGWSEDEFIEYWDAILDIKATYDILRRSPTIFSFSSSDACALVLILTNRVNSASAGVSGYRLDKQVFMKFVSSTAKNKAEHQALQKVVADLHYSTEIGKLDPEKTVRVIYELLTTAPSTPS